MDPLRILKALSNPHRLDIILWLKHPEQEFGVQVHSKTLIDFPNSVSVKSIQKRCGVSQSSVSTFMTMLERADLVESRKLTNTPIIGAMKQLSANLANGTTKKYPSKPTISTNYWKQ